jgi:flavin-dependent dehydrogenase
MIESKIIVVGGGPSGSACARSLKQAGLSTLVLDKKVFPRQKICAGWITPRVFKTLDLKPASYPHTLNRFNRIYFHLLGIQFPVRTCQYAIRRDEFDEWMLLGAKVPVHPHKVKHIRKHGGYYIIDETYRCRYLVGAGGTHCPVYKFFFSQTDPRPVKAMISAVEKEYQCDFWDDRCHIWYFENRLPGYAWYLPKGNGWLNLGIGGKFLKLKQQKRTIMDHWHLFVKKLLRLSLIKKSPREPKGHNYYLLHKRDALCRDNIFIIGDAAGVSTLDMGEGIHSAIKSGMMAAAAIINHKQVMRQDLKRFSLPGIFLEKNHDR